MTEYFYENSWKTHTKKFTHKIDRKTPVPESLL